MWQPPPHRCSSESNIVDVPKKAWKVLKVLKSDNDVIAIKGHISALIDFKIGLNAMARHVKYHFRAKSKKLLNKIASTAHPFAS